MFSLTLTGIVFYIFKTQMISIIKPKMTSKMFSVEMLKFIRKFKIKQQKLSVVFLKFSEGFFGVSKQLKLSIQVKPLMIFTILKIISVMNVHSNFVRSV